MKTKSKRLLTMLLACGFLLGVRNGKLALWRDGEPHPEQIYDIRADTLPPADRLRLRRGECWIFSERNPAAAALAKSLSESREPFLAVFCGAEENAPRPRDRRVILFPGDAAEAAAGAG